ncbi:hypothetical protein [Desulforamulus aquiferis]|nr:hypothetical protein [Desulforamulus aquiferis]
MNNKKFIIHAIGIFITITALQAFAVDMELTKEIGISWYWEFAKVVLAKDLFIKAFIALLTSAVIVKYMGAKRTSTVPTKPTRKKGVPKVSGKK